MIMKNAGDAIEFYKNAFGAIELFRMPQPDGKIGHAEIKIGDSPIMLSDEHPEMKYLGPETIGGTPVSLIYVDDVDTVFNAPLIKVQPNRRPYRISSMETAEVWSIHLATSGTSLLTKKTLVRKKWRDPRRRT